MRITNAQYLMVRTSISTHFVHNARPANEEISETKYQEEEKSGQLVPRNNKQQKGESC